MDPSFCEGYSRGNGPPTTAGVRALNIRSILITGASSGIGAALALHYAAPNVRLCLGGRSAARLEEIASACRTRGASVAPSIVDVTDRAAVRDWVITADDAMPIDLVIANAGTAGHHRAAALTDADVESDLRQILAVNLDGVVNTVLPIMPRMRARRTGRIAIMGSLAGYRGLPGAAAYSASKAAVAALGDAWRGELAAHGVAVTVICPGFIVSPLTDLNTHPMPWLMPTARAARIMARGIEQRRARMAFPWQLALLASLVAALPARLSDRVLALGMR